MGSFSIVDSVLQSYFDWLMKRTFLQVTCLFRPLSCVCNILFGAARTPLDSKYNCPWGRNKCFCFFPPRRRHSFPLSTPFPSSYGLPQESIALPGKLTQKCRRPPWQTFLASNLMSRAQRDRAYGATLTESAGFTEDSNKRSVSLQQGCMGNVTCRSLPNLRDFQSSEKLFAILLYNCPHPHCTLEKWVQPISYS